MKKSYVATAARSINNTIAVENLIHLGEKKAYDFLSFDELEKLDQRAITVCMTGERTKLRYVDNLIYVAIYCADGTLNAFSNVDAFEYANDIESLIMRGAEARAEEERLNNERKEDNNDRFN